MSSIACSFTNLSPTQEMQTEIYYQQETEPQTCGFFPLFFLFFFFYTPKQDCLEMVWP